MIAKDYAAPATTDRFQRAGDEAEKQMAFYLKRAFGDDPAVHVFHNLRLEENDDVVQIDHLILHRHGAIVIESKSVTSTIRINERYEWLREWKGRWSGRPSPVLQARRQADFLRKQLRARREELLDRALFGLVQRGLGMFVFDVVVAIIDQGMIQHQGQLPEVRKVDQVVDRVRELLRDQAGLASFTGKDPRSRDWGMTLKPEELTRTSAYLRNAHRERPPSLAQNAAATQNRWTRLHSRSSVRRPSHPVPRVVEPVSGPAASSLNTPPTLRCSKCSGERLEVAYGKYGYYLKCFACDGNTRIDLKCAGCGGKLRTRKTRKSGREFFAECQPCGSSRLSFVNPG